jgi:hypothetical protein
LNNIDNHNDNNGKLLFEELQNKLSQINGLEEVEAIDFYNVVIQVLSGAQANIASL